MPRSNMETHTNNVKSFNNSGVVKQLPLPPQLRKPREWVDFTLQDAQQHGWEEFSIIKLDEIIEMPASELKQGKHVFPDGKEMNKTLAMSLAKQRWSPKTKEGTHEDLYNKFSVAFDARVPKQEVRIQTNSNSNSNSEEIEKLKKKLAALEADKIDSLCNETHEDFYGKGAECKPEPFNMQHAMEQIQNMYSSLVGDRIKHATTRIAQSLRDFIMSIYEENEENRVGYDKDGDPTYNDDWEGEQPVAVNYVCLCKVSPKQGYVDVRGYIYLITTHAVYRSTIDIFTGNKKEYIPNPFQQIYWFDEPESVNNVRNNVLISYCKRNILMVKPSDEPNNKGRSLRDILMFCIKLESIFRVFYNPDPSGEEEAQDAYKMGRMISAHPGMSEEESIAETLTMQKIRKEAKKDLRNLEKKMKEREKRNENDGVNNDMAHPWTYDGKKVYRTKNGYVWARNNKNEIGNYMGKYNKATNFLDTSAKDPYENE
jgi:hypothetical protein